MTELIPPAIFHFRYNKADNWRAIVDDAAKGIHMSKGEKALLRYYAETSSGHRPAAQAIADATGQNRSQVFRNRQKAIDQGILIAVYEKSNIKKLMVDWSRLKLFASLDPKLTSKRCFIAGPKPYHGKKTVPSVFAMKFAPLGELIPKLAALTESQFESLQRRISKSKGA